MAEEVSLTKIPADAYPKWNAVLAESDVIIRIGLSHAVVQKDRLGSGEVKYYEFQGNTFICYRLR